MWAAAGPHDGTDGAAAARPRLAAAKPLGVRRLQNHERVFLLLTYAPMSPTTLRLTLPSTLSTLAGDDVDQLVESRERAADEDWSPGTEHTLFGRSAMFSNELVAGAQDLAREDLFCFQGYEAIF